MGDRYDTLVRSTKDFFKKQGVEKAVIGVSGGVDSALCLKIITDAIGSDNVIALLMPERGLTKQENIRHAKELCEGFGVKHHVIYINDFLKSYISTNWETTENAVLNLRPRIRATLLYLFANTNRAMVIGTSNRTELMLGYFTKYGDGAVDVELIGGLFKTEVWQMAKEAGIPDEIVSKTPSAELKQGQSDEEELGISYEEADEVLKQISEGKKGHPKYEKVMGIIKSAEHKRHMPPVMEAK